MIKPYVELFTVAYDNAAEELICARRSGPLEGPVFEGVLPAGRLVSAVMTTTNKLWLAYYVCTWNTNAVLLADGALSDSLVDVRTPGVPNDVLADLRARYADLESRPDPAHLWPDDFMTVYQLRRMYETILSHPLMKDTFRRRVIPFLRGTGKFEAELGRPAELFEFIAEEG
jgi:hypothetical protein